MTQLALLLILLAPLVDASNAGRTADATGGKFTVILWKDPVNIESRDLFYGSGGKSHQPHGELTFIKEDTGGSNPKYVVKDASGVKWKIKLGTEARPETVAARFVWAAGYFADEDYFLPKVVIKNVPTNLKRGRKLFAHDGTVHDVRFERPSADEKAGIWRWRHQPFRDTREFNGLRVLMAVINNWDLKDVNNGVYERPGEHDTPQRIYMVTDLGATFGSAGRRICIQSSKGNLPEYERSKFIRKIKSEEVDFNVPARPTLLLSFRLNIFYRLRMTWIGHHIPREDARWMGRILGRLSPKQIRDAFRAAAYDAGTVEAFARVVEDRIAQLNEL